MSEAKTFLTSQLSGEITPQEALDAFIEGAKIDYKIEHTHDCFHYFSESLIGILRFYILLNTHELDLEGYFNFLDDLANIDPFVRN